MLPERENQIIPPSRRRREEDANFDVLVRLKQAADELDRRPRTLVDWAVKGTLGFPRLIKVNNRYFISRRALEAWKAERLNGLSGVSLGEA
jgi:hypothetical protein